MSNDFPSADLVKRMILEGFTQPVIFRGFINDWEILLWTLDTWAEKIGNKTLPFRSGNRKTSKCPQWEAKCEKVNLTLRDFIELESNRKKENEQSTKWMYFDYKYMNEWFSEQEDVLNAVTWKNFGFPERCGADSTLWIGNNGAHTPCHMDTYGCNLVAQVFGRTAVSGNIIPIHVDFHGRSCYDDLDEDFWTVDRGREGNYKPHDHGLQPENLHQDHHYFHRQLFS